MPEATPRISPGRATAALLVLLVLLIAGQFAGVSLAHSYAYRISGVASTYWQWSNYLANPADVLFVGDSRAREDVDTAAIQSAVWADLGKRLSVGKLGFDSAEPRDLLGMMYRVTNLARRPKVVLYAFSEYQFSGYTSDPTYDFWSMVAPFDPGFIHLTFDIDVGNQQRLLTGFVSPLNANLTVLETGAPCTVHDLKRFLAEHSPLKLSGALDALGYCDTPPGFAQLTMTPQSRDVVYAQYRQIFADNYSFSETQASYVKQAVAMARAAGIQVAFFVPPEYHFEDLNPAAYMDFQSRTTQLASEMGVKRYDFHTEFGNSPELWSDPAHLNRAGTAAFVPQLAAMVESELRQT